MLLPNGDQAVISMQKLTGYCLNPNHSSGKHKARVFASVLGITIANAEELKRLVAQAAVEGQIVERLDTRFGQTIKVDWSVPGYDKVILRTIWEIAPEKPNPRLVSAFIRRGQ